MRYVFGKRWMAVLCACAIAVGMFVPTALASGVAFEQSKYTIDLWGGKTLKLSASVDPEGSKVTWKSSNTKVATVDKGGKVTAKKKGNVTITASISGARASVKVQIVKPSAPSKLKISAESSSMLVGDALALVATATPSGRSKVVTWHTSNAKVATVSKTGVVTAVSSGNVTIKAVSRANKKVTAKVSLSVMKTEPAPIPPPQSASSINTPLYGLCFGPYLTQPNGSPLTRARITALLQPLVGKTTWIRLYSSVGDLGTAAEIAKGMGFKVAASAYLSKNTASNAKEIAALKALIDKGGIVDCAIVGSEAMLNDYLNANQLVSYIKDVKNYVNEHGGGVPVVTAEPFHVYEDYPILAQNTDWLFFHAYPSWDEQVPPERWISFLHEKMVSMTKLAGGKPVVLGESGAPSARNGVQTQRASLEVAGKYLQESIALMREQDIPYFVFEAYDEKWKSSVELGYGDAFGLYDINMRLKYPDLYTDLPGPSAPNTKLDVVGLSVPKLGDVGGRLGGRVVNMPADGVKMAVYLYANGNYYVKPYGDERRLTNVDSAGRFDVNVVTGGHDEDALQYKLVILTGDATAADVTAYYQLNPSKVLKTITITRSAAGWTRD